MSILTKRHEPDTLTFNGVTVRVNTSFDTILRVLELQQDKLFDDAEKLYITLEMLIDDHQKLNLKKWEEISAVVNQALALLSRKTADADSAPVIDFNIDAERIYASFLQDYDIDLSEQQGRMTWQKFIALLNTLSDDTPLMKAVGYRVMEIPPETKGKERERLMKLKRHYELPTQRKEREQAILAYMERLKKE
ncbi:Gp15 family bacteriophage protein [Atopococcus tabaci]|uniref:Gp15 family bacteriophage protein n=1 Tax=Atopococcus tabaci TaxID=269774 RepID=UPI0024099F7C|nr:Gp15 family bacteriophage protein [Atopococcus tabaci]